MAFTTPEKIALANGQIVTMQKTIDDSNAQISAIQDTGVVSIENTTKIKSLRNIASENANEIMAVQADLRENLEPRLAQEQKLASVEEIPLPGGGVAKVTTVQTDGMFEEAASTSAKEDTILEAKGLVPSDLAAKLPIPSLPMLPGIASSALSSAKQKSSELMRAIGGQGTAKTVTPQNAGSSLTKQNSTTENFMMKLTSKQTGNQIIFNVTPTIDESRSANYEHISPVHHPGTIQVYKNTEARQFNIGVKLIARTSKEASANIKYLNWIRSWVMPYYGQGTSKSSESARLGAPPDILLFDVYGNKNIANIPVVLTSYHWVYPDTCDYIPTEDGVPFPTIMDISLSLIESYSPEEYSSFNIVEYKDGNMLGAFTFSSTPSSTSSEESGT